MFQNVRQEQIVQRLKNNQTVKIAEIASHYGVTRETIRRDLYELEKQGLITKVHGGAMLNKANEEPVYSKRAIWNVQEKQAIARKAASFVEDGDAIYIDLGTTTLLFAEELMQKRNITVITSALLVALEMSKHPSAKVILCGGELRPGELSLSGPIARKTIEDFFVDKAFIGVGGISKENGFTDFHIGEAEIRSLVLQRAGMKITLADHSKFSVVAFTKVASIKDMDLVITDSKAPEALIGQLRESGVEVVIADGGVIDS
ncbi:DeoR/GlpR family DNA-binding transcription regulator [Paenibacillus sp. OV219]|uniref:DeoR/GlpR family DNA-binding transcription regulator n=1 Tax=Paenibacillus sp. OV219 TaxID=1884377 RepID=UPI0008C86CE3|nr:DeoR/GlpR family DNA-binding transcription regulator [Paenibacillus sp. OV219]SEN80784.1 transcriptional regulator, DeoR family [Paenibacillus sp. OV219]